MEIDKPSYVEGFESPPALEVDEMNEKEVEAITENLGIVKQYCNRAIDELEYDGLSVNRPEIGRVIHSTAKALRQSAERLDDLIDKYLQLEQEAEE